MITNSVFVIDKNGIPLKPTTPARARFLQSKEKAKKFRLYPFVIMLDKDVDHEVEKYLELRIDPGSKVTGFSLVVKETNEVIWGMELEHRGEAIKQDLISRAGYRRGRRSRNLRYRMCRFNRKKPAMWLAPSLRHRLLTVETWVKRLIKYAPIASIAIEEVKFDMQKMESPDIEGIQYQQGTLAGYTIREALLEKWGRQCAYCTAKDVPLQIEHIHPKSKGGSDRFANLTLACEKCNKKKSNKSVEEFLKCKPEVLKKVKATQKKSLSDAAAVNSTRKAIVHMAQQFDLPVISCDAASTKMVRVVNNLPKEHWIDAACVNAISSVNLRVCQPLRVVAKGHGSRQSRRVNASGFPVITSIKKDLATGKKIVKTIEAKKEYTHTTAGDFVWIKLEKDRKHVKKGRYKARVKTPTQQGVEIVIDGHRITVNQKHVTFIHRNDGYSYGFAAINTELLQ
ncbi:RNA-guided endonuclease IscB [Scytonema sp. PRP1]|uniref:RNA-guided endonuclease IscB n=1 Tax=Scytonema sp. PRP1 TaxID=3120513 RepID=UPI002FD72E04